MASNSLKTILFMYGIILVTFVTFCAAKNVQHHHHYIAEYCKGKPDGEHPHPLTCSQFIHCANSIPHVKNCPEPDKLVFDPNLKVCVWKSDYHCVDKGDSGTSSAPGTNHQYHVFGNIICMGLLCVLAQKLLQ